MLPHSSNLPRPGNALRRRSRTPRTLPSDSPSALRAMALWCCSSILRCSSRSARPRPLSFLGIIAFLSCWGCPCFVFQPSDGGAGEGTGGGGGSADSGDGEDAEAHPVPTKGANSEVGAELIHSNDNKNGDIEQIKLVLTTIQHCLASIDKHLKTLVDFHALIDNRLTAMMGISGFAPPLAITQGPSTAAVVTGTPANEQAAKRMKGLLGSMCSIVDKLPMFCGPVLIWLLSNSGQNSDNPWIQVIVPGSLLMCFISFILLAFTSKFKERESIDGVIFKISIWLLLPVFFALWPGLCIILHLFTHTSKFILWPLGALFSIISVSFWYLNFYKEHQKILEELKGGCVPENVALPENPKSEAASAQGLQRDNSYTVQITDPCIGRTAICTVQVRCGGSPYRGVS